MTDPEKTTGEMLQSIGFVVKPFSEKSTTDPSNCFYAQMPFHAMWLDFALPAAKIALEVNGDYWHGSRTKTLNTIQVKRQMDDTLKRIALSQEDWKLLTLVASDLKRPRFAEVIQNRIWGLMDV